MIEHILYAMDGTPIILSQKRYLIAKKYRWFVTSNGHGKKMLITYFEGKSYTFNNLVFGQRVRRKDTSLFDYTKRNILGYGHSGRTAMFKKYSNNTSGYKYVSKSGKKWAVSIRVNGKLEYKGKFIKIEDAAVVADYWAYKIGGVNAYQNFHWGSRKTLAKKCREILINNGYSIVNITDI